MQKGDFFFSSGLIEVGRRVHNPIIINITLERLWNCVFMRWHIVLKPLLIIGFTQMTELHSFVTTLQKLCCELEDGTPGMAHYNLFSFRPCHVYSLTTCKKSMVSFSNGGAMPFLILRTQTSLRVLLLFGNGSMLCQWDQEYQR